MTSIPLHDITGLVICGGRGTRMGGVDKGLQGHGGMPLALHALQRLRPQVGSLLVNANRNLDAYQALAGPSVPVFADALPDHPGPLAGWLAALDHCSTPHLATVPCDTPNFPADLVARLAGALMRDDADIAVAATFDAGSVQLQPVFCLMKTSLQPALLQYLHAGQRQIQRWVQQQRCTVEHFDNANAFFNINTAADLQHLSSVAAST